jgi:hypothetical protein
MIDMQRNDLRVSQLPSGSWLVARVADNLPTRVFRLKAHAIAYARALAFTGDVRLCIYGPDGVGVIQAKESLTYPRLDD